MDAERSLIAQTCLQAAHDGSLSFPRIIGRLTAAGFEGYAVDYRQSLQSFHLPSGQTLTLPMPGHDGPVALTFDAQALQGLIRWAQSGAADYSYLAFSKGAKAAGCAGYILSFPGRRVLYFGRTAETHVEHFPN